MQNKFLIFLLCFVFIIGVFTFQATNYNFSLESYLTDVSNLDEAPQFPNFKFTAINKVTDTIEDLDESISDTNSLIKKVYYGIQKIWLYIGYVFALLYDLVYWIINLCVYLVKMVIWFIKLVSTIFIKPKISVDQNFYNNNW